MDEQLINKRVVVFGANGYIGQHLVQYLKHNGADIIACDIQPFFLGSNTSNYKSVDITNKDHFSFIDESFHQIYFFSGLTGTDVSLDQYEKYISVNEIGLLHLLHHVSGLQNKPKVIFPSTRLVYKGVKNTPLTEEAEKEFKTIYASSKYNGELYLKMFANLYDITYNIFRICVPYGNVVGGKLSYGTIGFFLDKADKGEAISLYGDGDLKRTFTHVLDVCRQVVYVSGKAELNNECFNIDGETFSLLEVATIIASKYAVAVTFSPWPAKALKLESGDTIFDATKIRQKINSTIHYSFQEWIKA